jgi:cell division protein FtsQ
MQSLYGNWKYFRIHEIEINGCVMTDPATLRRFADISYEMNMLTIDREEMQQRLEEHPWIARATVRRIWPDGLTIGVTEYRPQALVLQEGAKGFEYFDKKGTVFAEVNSGQEIDLPVITGLDTFDTESEKKELLATAAEFLRLAGRNNPNLPAQNVSEIHFSNGGELTLYLVEHPFPIYFGRGEVKRKYYQLRKVLEVLYRKRKGRAMIEKVAYIRMDYQKNKVLVAKRHAG